MPHGNKGNVLRITITDAIRVFSESDQVNLAVSVELEKAKRCITNSDENGLIAYLNTYYETEKTEAFSSNYNCPQDSSPEHGYTTLSDEEILFGIQERRALLRFAIEKKQFTLASIIFNHEIFYTEHSEKKILSAKFSSDFLNNAFQIALTTKNASQADAILNLNELLAILENFRITPRNISKAREKVDSIPKLEALFTETGASEDKELNFRLKAIKDRKWPKPDLQEKPQQATPPSISKQKALEALEKKLKEQLIIYNDRKNTKKNYHGLFFGSLHFAKGYSADEKHKETHHMLTEVKRLLEKLKNPAEISVSTWSSGKAASNDGVIVDSTLTKLYRELIALGGEDHSMKSKLKLKI